MQTTARTVAATDRSSVTSLPSSREAPLAGARPAPTTIRVRDLRLRTYIGFNEEERTKQQDVVINFEITYLPHPGVLLDEVDSALDYKAITKRIISHVETNRFLLLEKLVADILNLCTTHESVLRAHVTVDKPHALRFADSVSVTMEHRSDGSLPRTSTDAEENLR